ncbi:protein NEOXANTHIN-DEFICIENT 1 isoform X1 [Lolium rigidum]|uniref:protein NEOXANTHIN-DEFICIENT 1 isoform X1 n=1 Tax=Lolium rigidum TaxID=89674 RepID=UPI001F5C281D|nr:protein NEOXANTHIN-DEFICIENT 1 isoform X1 [Lolium rigidum]
MEDKPAAGYRHGPPWVFKGSALYQLHLVKAATARAFVPKDLRLVEAFGYTLGGMFLARYHDSPAGQFDELVVIAGIVWNPPTSCAWAARVLVNSAEACRHGRKEVGLPSHVAKFSQTEASELRNKPLAKPNGFLSLLGMGSTFSKKESCRGFEISETTGSSTRHLCNISLPATGIAAGSHKDNKWIGPAIRMSLPSFSGQTEDHPDLLKYSCKVECRVRPVSPAKIWNPRTAEPQECSDGKNGSVVAESDAQRQSVLVLLSRPILALEFSSLLMRVDAPKTVPPHSKKKEVRYSST